MQKDHQQYTSGTIFTDHATSYIVVHHQMILSATVTVNSKWPFEQGMREMNVAVLSYYTNNGTFWAEKFAEVIQSLW